MLGAGVLNAVVGITTRCTARIPISRKPNRLDKKGGKNVRWEEGKKKRGGRGKSAGSTGDLIGKKSNNSAGRGAREEPNERVTKHSDGRGAWSVSC